MKETKLMTLEDAVAYDPRILALVPGMPDSAPVLGQLQGSINRLRTVRGLRGADVPPLSPEESGAVLRWSPRQTLDVQWAFSLEGKKYYCRVRRVLNAKQLAFFAANGYGARP